MASATIILSFILIFFIFQLNEKLLIEHAKWNFDFFFFFFLCETIFSCIDPFIIDLLPLGVTKLNKLIFADSF